jgi:hypothetical protein
MVLHYVKVVNSIGDEYASATEKPEKNDLFSGLMIVQ